MFESLSDFDLVLFVIILLFSIELVAYLKFSSLSSCIEFTRDELGFIPLGILNSSNN